MKSSTKSGRPAKMDMRGVAMRAGVSIATVSRAINHVPSVDPLLVARVWKAVEELDYFPDTQARALVSGVSKLLGLIVSDITNPFFPELIQEFENVAVEKGYEILIGSTNHDAKKMERCVRRMLERKVDAVAIMTFGIEDDFLVRFATDDIPVASIDVGKERPGNTILSVDYAQGIHEGVQHLAVLGHRKIGFISGPLNLHSAMTRKSAFLSCLRMAGIKPNSAWLIQGDHTLDGGRDAMQKILALHEWPTAIMCSNDMTAIGVQHALFEANLKVPDDFSLIGFDDVHLAEYTIPPLTTIRMGCKDLAQAAVTNLLAYLQFPEIQKPSHSRIPTRLIVRQTTGLPKGALNDLQSKPRKETRKDLAEVATDST
ncbi:MAG: LacI family transcriptional regulator [Acidobacteriota bacterium]|nr:LacI family transcriptional regulator [Acidobacteriota bacterium]